MMDKLLISTINCEGIKRSRDYLFNYLNDSACNILCVQESWHLDTNADIFSVIHSDYLYTAISGVDSKELFLLGRPKGGVGIFYKKSLSSKVKPIKSNNRRVCGLVINLATNFTCLLLSVYLPCDNYCSIVNME